MRRIRYSVAMSLDGYIAGPNGEYDWIELDPSAGAAYFKAFYAQFDTVLMGRKSYEQAGGGVEPFKTYVVSRTLPSGKRGDVTVLGSDALERIAALREEPGKDIWLWGGGELFGSLAAAGLVDSVEIGVVPVLLGAGRKVMAGCNRRVKLVQRPPDLELPGHTLLVYDVEKRGRPKTSRPRGRACSSGTSRTEIVRSRADTRLRGCGDPRKSSGVTTIRTEPEFLSNCNNWNRASGRCGQPLGTSGHRDDAAGLRQWSQREPSDSSWLAFKEPQTLRSP